MIKIVELSPHWVRNCKACQHWPATSRGCMIPEDKLDWRGEPSVGEPEKCRYFETGEKKCHTVTRKPQ